MAGRRTFTGDHPLLSKRAAQVGAWCILLAWAAFALTPIAWLLLAATKTSAQLTSSPPFSFGSLENLVGAWNDLYSFGDGQILDWIENSLILSFSGVLISVLVTIPAGYALGTFKFRLRKPLLMVTIGFMLLPASALVLPLFLQMTQLGLVGNRLAVILPLAVFPFGLYIAFIYFSTTIGRDIYDAARIDGCGELKVLWRIAIPLSRPIVALVAFFAFMRSWNDFVLAFVLLSNSTQPLPVGLALIASQTVELAPEANPIAGVDMSVLVLATLITMIPVATMILLAQRTIIRGAGALGGALRG